MRGAWGKMEYRDMAQHWLGFSAPEQQALPRTVAATELRLAGLK